MERYDRPQRYRAFLLRCWKVRNQRPGQPGKWRFRLEDVQTGERHGFADLAALGAFLRVEFDVSAEQAGYGGDSGRR